MISGEQTFWQEMTDLNNSAVFILLLLTVLMGYPKNKGEYHPSSYLRLLMFYMYKNGYKRTCKRFKGL